MTLSSEWESLLVLVKNQMYSKQFQISKRSVQLNFFRIGRISFREARRKRTFARNQNIHHWLLINIDAAKKEYDTLNQLVRTGIRIPTLYYRSMHCVVMNRIDGLRLVDIRELEAPKITLQGIL